MNCERHRRKIEDELLRGERAPGAATVGHLRECPDCQEYYEAQKRLLVAMDSGIRAMVKEEAPSSLLPAVRARMEEPEMARHWAMWSVTAAGLVAAVFIFSPFVRRRAGISAPQVPIIAVGSSTTAAPSAMGGAVTVGPAVHPVRRKRTTHLALQAAVALSGPAVVVGPDEARGLEQLAREARVNPELAIAMTRPTESSKSGEEALQPLEFSSLNLAPLSEESDSSSLENSRN